MSKYGEPWGDNGYWIGDVELGGNPYVSVVQMDGQDWERAKACVNAMEGVENPAELMDKVRDLLSIPKGYTVEDIVGDILALLPGMPDGE